MRSTRRTFLKRSIGTSALLASGLSLPGLLEHTARAGGPRVARGDLILVVVQLTGGNDGLNTVIPYRDDRYREARPTLAVQRGRELKLDDRLGLHPEMPALKGLYDEGLLALIENVGYPEPDRSHFRSMDIWHAARLDPEKDKTGWLGRAMDGDDGSLIALHLDDGPLPMALVGDSYAPPSIRDIGAFRRPPSSRTIEAAIRDMRPSASEDLLFVQQTILTGLDIAKRLEEVVQEVPGPSTYPDAPFGQHLRQIAQLIGAEFGAPIYYTSMAGFDTHSKQAPIHGSLLRTFSDGVAAFFKDLKHRTMADRVVLMAFSEFGRRVMENGSQGTDHGAAAPVFVAGPHCLAGIHGTPPDLEDLDNGDIKHKIDFRQVYAGILEGVLVCDSAPVLHRAFEPVRIIRK